MKRSYKVLAVIVSVLPLLVLMVLSYRSCLWVDSSVILVEMERIAEGFVPYRTMHLNYPPLWFYMMAGLKKLFSVPYGCYPFYLTVHYLFTAGCSWLVFAISRRMGARVWASLLSVWIMLLACFWMYGDRVLFEMPSLFFGLLSVLLVLSFRDGKRYHFIYIGAISGCAFLVKQFGVGFLLLDIYLILFYCRERISGKLVRFLAGYSVPIVICLAIWRMDIVSSVLMNGYGGEEVRMMVGGVGYNFVKRLIVGSAYFCLRFPFVVLSVWAFPWIARIGKWKEVLFCLCGIGGFLLQMKFIVITTPALQQPQSHYLLYVLPFAAMLLALMLSFENQTKCYRVVLLCCVCVSVAYSGYRIARFSIPGYLDEDSREMQRETADRVNGLIDGSKTVWIADGSLEYLYYLCNLYPADMKNIGYSTGCFEITPEKALSEVHQADYVIYYDDRGEPDWWRCYFSTEVQDYVYGHPSVVVDRNQNIALSVLK